MSLNTAIQKAMFPMNKSAPPAWLRLSFESKCLCLMLGFTAGSPFHHRFSLLGLGNVDLIPLDRFTQHVHANQLYVITAVLHFEYDTAP